MPDLKRGTGDGTFVCPHCGAALAAGSRSCPECGSDEKTGWSEDAETAGADIPAGYAGDDEFEYDGFLRREFDGDGRKPAGPSRKTLLVVVVAVLLLIALIVLAVAAR